MKYITKLILYSVLLFIIIGTGETSAQPKNKGNDNQPVLWVSKDAGNNIYLLGSIHALAKQDYPLPKAYEDAYQDAEQTVFEIELTPDAITKIQRLAINLATFKDGKTLKQTLGDGQFSQMNKELLKYGTSLKALNRFEPWFVTLNLANLQIAEAGISPEFGVDPHFYTRAIQDGKGINALETVEEQLNLFDTIPMPSQISLLEQSVFELQNAKEKLVHMVAAWRMGDVGALEILLNEEFLKNPDLARTLLYQRNRSWAKNIEKFFGQKDDYLIIVGAGHLIGRGSVIDLLAAKGHHFVRVE